MSYDIESLERSANGMLRSTSTRQSVRRIRDAKEQAMASRFLDLDAMDCWVHDNSSRYREWKEMRVVRLLNRLNLTLFSEMPPDIVEAIPGLIEDAINAIPPEPPEKEWWEFWK